MKTDHEKIAQAVRDHAQRTHELIGSVYGDRFCKPAAGSDETAATRTLRQVHDQQIIAGAYCEGHAGH